MRGLKQIFFITSLSILTWFNVGVAGEPSSEALPPPEIVIDAPPPTQSPVKQETTETETVTIYKSKVFPGFRKCTPEDYRNHDNNPVACQDEENARIISTREQNDNTDDLIIEDDAVPQGNIYKLKFERFKRKKSQK
jgi:hypothetical protein